MQLTDKQYEMLVEIYNNWEELFDVMPLNLKVAFYTRLYS